MAHAAIVLHDVTGEEAYLDKARQWMATIDAHYLDRAANGYFLTADDAEALIARTRAALDNATPAGNGLAAQVLAALYHLTGERAYHDSAKATITAFAGDFSRFGIGLASLVKGSELLNRSVDIVITGTRGEAKTDAFLRAVREVSLPLHTLQVVAPGTALPENHPAAGKTTASGQTAAFVCVNSHCSLPITEPEALVAILLSARSTGSVVTSPAA